MINLIALAIPFFLVLIALEAGWAWRQGQLGKIYQWEDTVSDLGCGISSQVTGQFLGAVVANGVYEGVYGYKLLNLSTGWPLWIGAFIGVDFLYYWWHRSSHRVNLLWAAHVVHHQSEDYNLAVALRQAIFTALTSMPFYWPLAILGVPPIVFFTCSALNTLYQFWIHTRLIGKMGPLEWILNTPSHHRVHHGIDPTYIDKNHAGVFIIWDRLFGTFVEEKQAPTYGVVEAFPARDPIRANLEPYAKLLRRVGTLEGWERLYVLIAPPEWRPEREGGAVVVPAPSANRRWEPPVSGGLRAYAVFWLLMSVAGITAFLLVLPQDDSLKVVMGGALVFWTIAAVGALLDGRREAKGLEGARILAMLVWLGWVVAP